MGFMGMEGMARRVYTYPAIGHLPLLNAIATSGAGLMTLGVVGFFVNAIVSVRRRLPVADNPWGGFTLEWLTSSPPPEFNFESLPPIRSRRPALERTGSSPRRLKTFVVLFAIVAAFGFVIAIDVLVRRARGGGRHRAARDHGVPP